MLGSLGSNHLVKLRLVDEVLAKYNPKEITSSALVPISKVANTNPDKANNQPYSATVDVNAEPLTDKTGALPRSIGRTINKIKKDLNPNSEAEVIRNFRSSRTKTVIAVRFLLTLIIVPFLTQQLSKHYIVSPIVEQIRGEQQSQVFLNSEMQEEAIKELEGFEENLKFQSLINLAPALSPEVVEEQVKHKASEIATEFRDKSSSAVGNVFADLLALGSFSLVLLVSKKEIVVLKLFIDDIAYGLSDSAKAFMIILFTDIFVGFHSPHGWEVVLEGVSSHLGIAANRSMIFLFIATFPVILDTIFKYWVFRYMSRVSPSAVATLRNMNE